MLNLCNLLNKSSLNFNIHFVGIGGVSMSSLAIYCLKNNFLVSGSDIYLSKTVKHLSNLGVKIYNSHSKNNLKKDSNNYVDMVIYSNATYNTEEVKFAIKNNIPTYSRGEFLGEILKQYKNQICVAGAHGKTTTTALIYSCLKNAFCEPSLHLGGNLVSTGKSYDYNNSSTIVCEACEYKDAFLNLNSKIGVITNLAPEHLDYFGTYENVIKSFVKFSNNCSVTVVNVDYIDILKKYDNNLNNHILNKKERYYKKISNNLNIEYKKDNYCKGYKNNQNCLNKQLNSIHKINLMYKQNEKYKINSKCKNLREQSEVIKLKYNTLNKHSKKLKLNTLVDDYVTNQKYITFGIHSGDYSAKNLKRNKFGKFSFDVYKHNEYLGKITSNLIGKHNVLNCLASIAVCDYLGVNFKDIKTALKSFEGVERRFQFLSKDKFIVHDYAHHPDEIKAVLQEVNKIVNKDKLVVVFQPHTYSRTKILMNKFVECFKNYKNVVIYKTYSAREKYNYKGSASVLAKNIGSNAIYFKNKKCIKKYIQEKISQDYAVIFLGAGDIFELCKNIVNSC